MNIRFNRKSLFLTLLLFLAISTSIRSQEEPIKLPSSNEAADLAAILKSPEKSYYQKMYTCKLVAQRGTAASIPVLVNYLNDPALSHYVRIALRQIPGQEADKAMIDALKKVDKPELVPGILRTLGERRNDISVPAVAEYLDRPEVDIQKAAAGALGQLGSPSAAHVLEVAWKKSDSSKRNIIVSAIFSCVHNMTTAEKNSSASALYQLVFNTKDILSTYQGAALYGLISTSSGEEQMTWFKKGMDSDSRELFNAAQQGVRLVDSNSIIAIFQKDFEKYCLAKQLFILDYIRSYKVKSALPMILKLATTPCAADKIELRNESLKTLGTIADVSHAKDLFASSLASQKGDWSVVVAHLHCLGDIEDPKMDDLVIDMLKKNEGPFRCFMLDLARLRQIKAGIPIYCADLKSENKDIRGNASKACIAIMTVRELPQLMTMIGPNTTAYQGDVLQTINGIINASSEKEVAADILLEYYNKQDNKQKQLFIDTLALTGSGKVLKVLFQAVNGNDMELKDNVLRVLGNWPNHAAASGLLDAVKNIKDPKLQVRAIRGYIRIIRQMRMDAGTKMNMAKNVLPFVTRLDELKLWIGAVGRIDSKTALPMVAPYLEKEETCEDACSAIIGISRQINMNDKEVQDYLHKVVNKAKTPETKGAAEDLLKGIVVKTR